ncbi:uncharacterized protein BX663DRAFT_499582 [Cokeromyces recurvatus]|uniref:uncharacterized protein n=1 Tax=Cokeromyces recurvatus TaxID=90255 RepID=UPI00221F0F0A|nr:uncharacterized protein BX663DRAFT_499582 [Cokeromyces recurvatus]KAI7905397.1 hypothetical protein BX663DRAFT_499582 [Cokeromyces recurvatus]
MDVLSKHTKYHFHIFMDKCRVHYSLFVVDAISQRDYEPLLMSPHIHSFCALSKMLVQDH